jgi:hypothetical protein
VLNIVYIGQYIGMFCTALVVVAAVAAVVVVVVLGPIYPCVALHAVSMLSTVVNIWLASKISS